MRTLAGRKQVHAEPEHKKTEQGFLTIFTPENPTKCECAWCQMPNTSQEYLVGDTYVAFPRAFWGYSKDLSPMFGAFWRFRSPGNIVCFSRRRRSLFLSRTTAPQEPLPPSLHPALQNARHPLVNDNVAQTLSLNQPLKSRTGLQKISTRYSPSAFASLHVVLFPALFLCIWLVVCRPGVVPVDLLPFRSSYFHSLEEPCVSKDNYPSTGIAS